MNERQIMRAILAAMAPQNRFNWFPYPEPEYKGESIDMMMQLEHEWRCRPENDAMARAKFADSVLAALDETAATQ